MTFLNCLGRTSIPFPHTLQIFLSNFFISIINFYHSPFPIYAKFIPRVKRLGNITIYRYITPYFWFLIEGIYEMKLFHMFSLYKFNFSEFFPIESNPSSIHYIADMCLHWLSSKIRPNRYLLICRAEPHVFYVSRNKCIYFFLLIC